MTLSLDPNGSVMRRNQHHTTFEAGFGTISNLLQTSATRQDNGYVRSFRYIGDTTVQNRSCYVLRSDFPQFRYVSYKVSKNETIASIANKFGCGEFRILERNKLSVNESLNRRQNSASTQLLRPPRGAVRGPQNIFAHYSAS